MQIPKYIDVTEELAAYEQAVLDAKRKGAPRPRAHGRLKMGVASLNRKNKRYALARIRRIRKL
jgi:hypothetical protein